MPQFRYQARNEKQQIVVGEVQAESVAEALVKLETEGLAVESIGYASAVSPAVSAAPASGNSVPPTDLNRAGPFAADAERAEMQRHLAGVLEQAQALLPALRAFSEEMPPGSERRQLSAVLQVLARGNADEAASALPALPEFWIPLLSAAATSRDPGRVLSVFLSESQRAAELRRQWRQAIAYPLSIVILAAVVFTALSFMVVPTFRDMFRDFNLRLPLFTTFIMGLAELVTSGRIVIVAAVVFVAGWLLLSLSRWLPASWQAWWGDRFGTPLGRSAALARFANFCADLLEAGLVPANALRIAGFTTRSVRLKRAAWRVAKQIERGESLPPRRTEPLTYTILYALRSDMSAANRIRLLQEVSQCHAERAARRISWTRGMIEPLAICLIGAVVGATVLALFMPLISLIHGLAG